MVATEYNLIYNGVESKMMRAAVCIGIKSIQVQLKIFINKKVLHKKYWQELSAAKENTKVSIYILSIIGLWEWYEKYKE